MSSARPLYLWNPSSVRGGSAARPAPSTGWRRQLHLAHGLNKSVVVQRRGETRIDRLVHCEQLRVALGRRSCEHALPASALPREAREQHEQREEGAEQLELIVTPALLERVVGDPEGDQAAVVVLEQLQLVHSPRLNRHPARDEHADVAQSLPHHREPEVDEHASAFEVLCEEDVLDVRVAVHERQRGAKELAHHRDPASSQWHTELCV
mmetsp:Transcript_37379/g.82244  ORF Transcript_37379/g.82244 Transcript_37379/m.82244 type:complete len:209 (-) Transcript_37379:934-1560(-)